MDNRNIYQQQQQPSYYPYGAYPAATTPMMRPELPAYMLPQTAPSAVLKGRPVSSFEEARVAQIDLDGSVSLSLAQEELLAELMATFGEEIIDITNIIFDYLKRKGRY